MLAAAVGYRRRLNAKAAPQTTVVGAALVDEQGPAAQHQLYLVALPHPQQSHDSEGAAQSLTGTPKRKRGILEFKERSPRESIQNAIKNGHGLYKKAPAQNRKIVK